MTVTQFVLGKYTGLSTDIKPKGDADPDLVTEFRGDGYRQSLCPYGGQPVGLFRLRTAGGTRGQSGIISEYGDAITDSETAALLQV